MKSIGFILVIAFVLSVFPSGTSYINVLSSSGKTKMMNHSSDDTEDLYLHYYVFSEGLLRWTSKRVNAEESQEYITYSAPAGTAETAKAVFRQFFADEEIDFKPKGVSVQDAVVIKGELLISVSGNIKDYGGTYYETGLRNQIIKTALGIPGVTSVSLYIDRKLQYLTEGSIIEEETDWSELTDELTTKQERLLSHETLLAIPRDLF